MQDPPSCRSMTEILETEPEYSAEIDIYKKNYYSHESTSYKCILRTIEHRSWNGFIDSPRQHLGPFERTETPDEAECRKAIAGRTTKYGEVSWNDLNTEAATRNEQYWDYSGGGHRCCYWKVDLTHNLYIQKGKVYKSHYSSHMTSNLASVEHCNYDIKSCRLLDGSFLTWQVNNQSECSFSKVKTTKSRIKGQTLLLEDKTMSFTLKDGLVKLPKVCTMDNIWETHQGFGVVIKSKHLVEPENIFEQIMNPKNVTVTPPNPLFKRIKRDKQSTAGIVTPDQLATGIQALQIWMVEQMNKGFKVAAYQACNNWMEQLKWIRLHATHNPSAAARILLNNPYVHAILYQNYLTVWECYAVDQHTFIASEPEQCTAEFPIRYTLRNINGEGFLDPTSMVIHKHGRPVNCATVNELFLKIENRRYMYNQQKGTLTPHDNIQNQTWLEFYSLNQLKITPFIVRSETIYTFDDLQAGPSINDIFRVMDTHNQILSHMGATPQQTSDVTGVRSWISGIPLFAGLLDPWRIWVGLCCAWTTVEIALVTLSILMYIKFGGYDALKQSFTQIRRQRRQRQQESEEQDSPAVCMTAMPLRIYPQLPPRTHKRTLSQPNYDTIHEEPGEEPAPVMPTAPPDSELQPFQINCLDCMDKFCRTSRGVFAPIKIAEKTIIGLFDTGCNFTIIRQSFYSTLKDKRLIGHLQPCPYVGRGVCGQELKMEAMFNAYITLGPKTVTSNILIAKQLSPAVIIGHNVMAAIGEITINLNENYLKIGGVYVKLLRPKLESMPSVEDVIAVIDNIPEYSEAPVVPIVLQGKMAAALFDTGAGFTLMSEKLARTLGCTILEAIIPSYSITGHSIGAVGTSLVTLTLGPSTMIGRIVIATSCPYDVIIGRDYMRKMGRVAVDFTERFVEVKDVKIPFLADDSTTNSQLLIVEDPSAMIALLETTTVPANSVSLLPVKIKDEEWLEYLDKPAIIEPKENFEARTDLVLLPGVVQPKKPHFFIKVINTTNASIKLYAKMAIATLSLLAIACVPQSTNILATEINQTQPTFVERQTWLKTELSKLESDLDPEDWTALKEKLLEYADVFSMNEWDIGEIEGIYHRIDTGDHLPIACPPRRLPFALQAEEQKLIQDQLNAKVIEASNSPWSFPILMVPKKDGTTRCAIDYRPLNAISRKDNYPLKNIRDIMDTVQGKWFTKLDMKSAYYHIKIHPDDRDKTSFRTKSSGSYRYLRLPFGLHSAPATFQRALEMIFRGLDWKILVVYLDDVLIWSESASQHLERLDLVLQRLRGANLKLKVSKCTFGVKKIVYLGHELSEEGIRMESSKIEAIQTWPTPTNPKEVLSFLGTVNYLRDHMPSFATIAIPLYALLKKDATFTWNNEEKEAFKKLKELTAQNIMLAYPNQDYPFHLETDACDYGAGARLFQCYDAKTHVITFASRTFTEPECKYSTIEKEALAVVWAIENFHIYLYGRHFELHTDHKPLTWLFNLKSPKGRLARWIIRLQGYDFSIKHIEGKKNVSADALSRLKFPMNEIVAVIDGQSTEFEDTTDEFQEVQKADPFCSAVLQYLSTEEWPQDFQIPKHVLGDLPNYFISNGLLCHRTTFHNESVDQLVIPEAKKSLILQSRHDHSSAAHMGIRKTYKRIITTYYWPDVLADTKEHCRTCITCQKRKSPTKMPKAQLKSIECTRIMQRISVDLVGPLPLTQNGNQYVLTFIENFSKWPEAFSIPDMKSERIARIFSEEIISRFGMPEELHSDQGANLISETIKSMCAKYGIKKTQTTALHPMGNGMIERLHRSIYALLSHYVNEAHDDWDSHLPHILFAYRTAVHESTGYSPFFMMFGRTPKYPLETAIPTINPQYVDEMDFATALSLKLQRAWSVAAEQIQAAQKSQKVQYDKKAQNRCFLPGDRVLIYTPVVKPGKSKKLSKFWTGPFTVMESDNDGLTLKVIHDKKQKIQRIHINRVKPLYEAEEKTTLPQPLPHEDQEDIQPNQLPQPEPQIKSQSSTSEPGEIPSQNDLDPPYHIVWAKLTGYPRWPAKIISFDEAQEFIGPQPSPNHVPIQYYDYPPTFGYLLKSNLIQFLPGYYRFNKGSTAKKFKRAIEEALTDYAKEL